LLTLEVELATLEYETVLLAREEIRIEKLYFKFLCVSASLWLIPPIKR